MASVMTRPVLDNTQYDWFLRGERFVPHRFATLGTSLHPLQRAGVASSDTLPTMGAGGTQSFGSADKGAAETNIANPPLIAFTRNLGRALPRFMI